MKISAYTELSAPGPNDYLVVALGGQNYKIKLSNALASVVLDRSRAVVGLDDMVLASRNFLSDSHGDEWVNTNPTLANHPGIAQLRSTSAFSINAIFQGKILNGETSAGAMQMIGDENVECIFYLPSVSSETINIGIIGTGTVPSVHVAYGVYVKISGSTLNGNAINNSGSSATPTSYAVSINTWYRVRVAVNAGRTRVDFYLYDANGLLLWSDSLTTYVDPPDGAYTIPQIAAWTSLAGNVDLAYVDWIGWQCNKDLVR